MTVRPPMRPGPSFARGRPRAPRAWLLALAMATLAAPARAQAPAYLLKEIVPPTPGFGSQPTNTLAIGGTIYFVAQTLVPATESTLSFTASHLWRTDGTAAGTEMLANFGNAREFFPQNLTDGNGTLYFTASLDNLGTEL